MPGRMVPHSDVRVTEAAAIANENEAMLSATLQYHGQCVLAEEKKLKKYTKKKKKKGLESLNRCDQDNAIT